MAITTMLTIPGDTLAKLGLKITEQVHYQLSPEELIDQTIARKEGILSNTGALVVNTGEFTGRSPKDKFTVKDEITANSVHWNDFNIPIEEKYFDIVKK